MASLASMILPLLFSTILINVVIVKTEDTKTESPTEHGLGVKSGGEEPQITPGKSAPNTAGGLDPMAVWDKLMKDISTEQTRPRRQAGGGYNPIQKGRSSAAESPKRKYLHHLQRQGEQLKQKLGRHHFPKANSAKQGSLRARQWQKQKQDILKYQRNQQRLKHSKKSDLYGAGKGAVTGRRLPKSRVHFTPLGVAAPVGPIQEEKRMRRLYGKYFNDKDDEIKFSLPKRLLGNCWMQAMVGRLFKPSCNEDGTYSPKQCHRKRCWCSDKYGKPIKRSGGHHNEGFYQGIKALTLHC
ncbi:uncharacterized protein LOC119726085 [Patiria miniata]|uniref:Thyroglobulin type-1 domain-containing protein n=1 Tax=Patiria miniata TaxID=46514 RepID=A0A913ZQH1_PATMI|nr:uncharacterized protein LOC119726085 [Patiria miniata]